MYAKVFEQIFDSSIANDFQTRHVFMDLLVLADQNGVIDRTPEAIARRTNVPLDIVKSAISVLEKPDPSSRSTDCDGARLQRLDEHREWGWQVVNYKHYLGIKTEFDRRRYMREYMRQVRSVKPCKTESLTQSNLLDGGTSVGTSVSVRRGSGGTTRIMEDAARIYEQYPRKVARPKALTAIAKQIPEFGFEVILAATIEFAKAWALAPKEEMQYCPHPTTWFNQQRFNDNPSTWKRNAQGAQGHHPQRVDRSVGTANEGIAQQYDLRKIQKARPVQPPQQPATGDV